ncbi:DUF2971 domain-containing protein [Leisingera sp. ANG-M1]|uniref:DUF2971 domain-containing protein n=1 Tax=Leisingera sp. ANG-M1 TaxID=1577895 RepID=UPI00126A3DC6|nr:DUF2971 domain-containing protein [Leisingera sp. ANG-M1]
MFIPKELENKYIYRVVGFQKFRSMFFERRNTLVRPTLWDDPMENLLLLRGYKDEEGRLGEFVHKDRYYAQCWSLESRSDAMWRVYAGTSKTEPGIRIRTTVGKLLRSLASKVSFAAHQRCRVGKVKYLSDNELNSFARDLFKGRETDDALASAFFETFLVKRKPFEWENEVRLIYFDVMGRCGEDVFHYDWDPAEVVDQILLSPFNCGSTFQSFKDEVCAETDFKGKILHSRLYEPPRNLRLRY